jgi:aminopeptidase-like protein
MILTAASSLAEASTMVPRCLTLAEQLYPLCRSIAGPALRQSFDLIERWIPLRRTEVPSGTKVYDWEAPREWHVRDAYIADTNGRRLIDWRRHNLHVVNYSVPVRATMSLHELEPHLHSLPDRPDWIPYRTSYYREDWGFCVSHRDREVIGPGPFEVVIDAEHRDGSLTYAECIVPGSGPDFAVVYVHSCHPSLANDNLSGIVVAAALADALRREAPRRTWRIVFGAGTIGSLAWLSRNEANLPRLRAGFTLGLLGDPAPITYKRSRQGNTATDRVAELVLKRSGQPRRVVDFEPYGYDERQFCSPGFDLPVGRLSRAQHGEYPEYHTSADDLSLLSADSLAGAIAVGASLIGALDSNRSLLNLSPKGEPRLGKRGLYGALGGLSPGESEQALLWVLSGSDGKCDLAAIARRSGLPFGAVVDAAAALESAGLLAELDSQPLSFQGVDA